MDNIHLEPFIPTTCCIAPETPMEKYNFGETLFPELPTCLNDSNHPESTTGLLAETSAYNKSANSNAKEIFSSFSMPLPTDTNTSADSKSISPADS